MTGIASHLPCALCVRVDRGWRRTLMIGAGGPSEHLATFLLVISALGFLLAIVRFGLRTHGLTGSNQIREPAAH